MRRPSLRQALLALLALYLAAAYLATAFRWVEAGPPVAAATPLPDLGGVLLSGVFSVHTGRSHDARGTREQVGRAAAAAGLDFVIVGDHPPDDRKPGWEFWEPVFHEGVFIEGGQELRMPEGGKILAMGLDTTWKRWEGDYASLVALLAREDATAFVDHGRGPRGSERWVHPTVEGLHGWQVLDISESSRHGLRGPWGLYHLVTLVAGTPLGLGDRALLHLMREGFDTPAAAAYDSLRRAGPLTATAGLNVHPKVELGPLLVPSYGLFFRTLVSHVVVEEPLPPDPRAARDLLAEAFRRGELFISAGGVEAAQGFRMGALAEGGAAARLGAREGAMAEDGASEPAPERMTIRGGFARDPGRKVAYRILRDGQELEWVLGPELEWEAPGPGLYRVEVHAYTARAGRVYFRLRPWIFANPVEIAGPAGGSG